MPQRLKTKWIIFLWILARCVFIGLPDTSVDLFPFADCVMPVSSYGWVNIEMGFICWLSYRWFLIDERKKIVGALVLILIFDWVHFLLSGNSFYFKIAVTESIQYPMTNNVLMLLFWGVFALKRDYDVV